MGDVGFLYADTASLHQLGAYDNYNSHVGKNFGVSQFDLEVSSSADRSAQVLKDSLSCSDEMRLQVRDLLKHYTRSINGITAILYES